MPIYVFECLDCQHDYEEYTSRDDTGVYEKVSCPICHSVQKKKMPARFAFNFGNVVGTSKMDNFGYRAGHNMENAKNERRVAEAASHMGSAPYNPINDVDSGEYFGEVE